VSHVQLQPLDQQVREDRIVGEAQSFLKLPGAPAQDVRRFGRRPGTARPLLVRGVVRCPGSSLASGTAPSICWEAPVSVDAAAAVIDPDSVDLDRVDLSDRDWWLAPPAQRHAVFDRLRRDRPFAFFAEPEIPLLEPGPGYWAVTRYADLDAISSQPSVFCSGRGGVSITDMPPDLNEFFGSMISMDDPRHAKIRRIVSKSFTPRVLERLTDSVQLVVDDVLATARRTAQQHGGVLDVVDDIAAPIPLRIICDLMGIPEEDRGMVLATSNVILSDIDPDVIENQDDPLTAILEAGVALAGLMERLAAERLDRPRDDLTTALVTTEVDGERLTHQEIASFFILLLVAGNETTRTAISQGILAVHEHPDQRARWAADESLTRTAVEEIVRFTSPVVWMRRTATRDGELNGHRFSAGDKSCCSTRRPTATPRCSATRTASIWPVTPTRTWASGAAAHTSASAPTWPGGRSR
jgi:methyl-branched lipid omega-hydroxylase